MYRDTNMCGMVVHSPSAIVLSTGEYSAEETTGVSEKYSMLVSCVIVRTHGWLCNSTNMLAANRNK